MLDGRRLLEERRDEWRRASGEGLPKVWDVAAHYRIANGVLSADGPEKRSYQPAAYPQIVTELAKLHQGDEGAARRFAEVWGLLGYRQLLAADARIPLAERKDRVAAMAGDPLPWVWAHARGVQVCLDLLGYLKGYDDADKARWTALADYLVSLGGQPWGSVPAPPSPSRLEDISFATEAVEDDGSGIESEPRGPTVTYGVTHEISNRDWLSGVLMKGDDSYNGETARQMICDIINPNLQGVQPQLAHIFTPTPFAVQYGSVALVEIVYWHLTQFVLGEMRLARCDECGAYFVRTDQRQRFCPPEPFAIEHGRRTGRRPESTCAKRAEGRRHRVRRQVSEAGE